MELGWNTVKAKDPITVIRYFEKLYINDLILILDTNLKNDEIQYCSDSVCYPKVTSHAEMKELYNQLYFEKIRICLALVGFLFLMGHRGTSQQYPLSLTRFIHPYRLNIATGE